MPRRRPFSLRLIPRERVVKSHWLRLEGSDILLHDNASNVAWFMNGCSILQSAGIR